MKRVIYLPKPLHLIISMIPPSQVIGMLTKFCNSPVNGKMVKRKGWVDYTLNDKGGKLTQKSDAYLQTLLRLIYEESPPESAYRDYLWFTIPESKREVTIDTGIVDILTPTDVIEVKKASDWKHAMGQVLAYSYTTGKTPVVALIGEPCPISYEVLKSMSIEVLTLG